MAFSIWVMSGMMSECTPARPGKQASAGGELTRFYGRVACPALVGCLASWAGGCHALMARLQVAYCRPQAGPRKQRTRSSYRTGPAPGRPDRIGVSIRLLPVVLR